MSKKIDLVDLFASAGESDLAAIDQQIQVHRATHRDAQQKIDGLLAIRKALELKLHGKAPRKKPERKAAAKPEGAAASQTPADGATPSQQIATAIRAHGPLTPRQIADTLGLAPGVIAVAVSRSKSLALRGALVHVVD